MSWLKGLALAAIAALAPIHAVMISVGVLICLDTIMGILAARKRKEPITSAELRRTVSKMIIYQIAIISGFLVQHYMLGDILPIVKLAAGAIGLVEIKSILENADEINGSPLFTSLVKYLGSQNVTQPPKEESKSDEETKENP